MITFGSTTGSPHHRDAAEAEERDGASDRLPRRQLMPRSVPVPSVLHPFGAWIFLTAGFIMFFRAEVPDHGAA